MERQAVRCQSPQMRNIYAMIERVAPTDLSVLISGEGGSGKEVIARAIFFKSLRSHQPFIKIQSGVKPSLQPEGVPPGRQGGPSVGAVPPGLGPLGAASCGTLFLDEIGDLAWESQSRLLQLIDNGGATSAGCSEPGRLDVRILAATNRDLVREVESGTFRRDLFYRLNVVHIRLPPLREHPQDIPQLARFFLHKYSRHYGKRRVPVLTGQQRRLLTRYSWPGNIRELERFIKELVYLEEGRSTFAALRLKIEKEAREALRLVEKEAERRKIDRFLSRNGLDRPKSKFQSH